MLASILSPIHDGCVKYKPNMRMMLASSLSPIYLISVKSKPNILMILPSNLSHNGPKYKKENLTWAASSSTKSTVIIYIYICIYMYLFIYLFFGRDIFMYLYTLKKVPSTVGRTYAW